MPKGFEPWFAVKVGARKNRKLVGLPDDSARYGWIAGVLAESKLQRPAGRFDSRDQLVESIGRFSTHVDNYIGAGLLEVAPRLCNRCRKAWGACPAGSIVVHDWRAHQRDPFSAARAEAWRSERENDDGTTGERGLNDEETTDERSASESDSPDVTADSRARGMTETDTTTGTGTETDSPQPPSRAGGRKSRANGTSPRQVAKAEAEEQAEGDKARRWRRQQRELAYHRGAITDAQRAEMNRRDAPLDELPDWIERLTSFQAGAPSWLPKP